jgi:hypothetical protein
MIEYEGDSLYHCNTCGNYIAENEFESEKPSKKLYFINIDALVDKLHTQLTDEEFIEKAEFVYDTIEEFVADFNSEMSPSEIQYYCRYI